MTTSLTQGESGKGSFDELSQILNKKIDEYLFFCLAERPDSNLMWSHYANSHKGFCLEWDTTNVNAEKVTYENNIASFELLDLIKTDYGLSNSDEIAKKVWEALKVKLKDWAYENEYRVQFGKKMEHLVNEKNSKFALVSHSENWIKSIIFGCRMDPVSIAYINERLSHNIERKYAVEKKSKIVVVSKSS